MVVKTLNEFQSIEFFALRQPGTATLISRSSTGGDNSDGVYTRSTRIQGNSILSTVYVHQIDPGATVKVRYLEATTGEIQGEELELNAHADITVAGNPPSKILVTRIHNKPICEVTVENGSAQFGVYATVVGSDASDIDSALQLEGSIVDFVIHKGIPIAGVDDSNAWKFARFTDSGELKIAGVLNADTVSAANDAKITIVSINATSWTPLPTTARTGRISISVQNRSGFEIALNYETPAGFVGKIYADQAEPVRDIKENVILYAKASPDITSAGLTTIDVIVEELADV